MNGLNVLKRYETVFILDSRLMQKETEKLFNDVQDFIVKHNGNIVEAKNIGLLKLEYEINNNSHGYYFFIEFSLDPVCVDDLNKIYKRNDAFIRTLICNLDNEAIKYNEMRRKNNWKIINNKKLLTE